MKSKLLILGLMFAVQASLGGTTAEAGGFLSRLRGTQNRTPATHRQPTSYRSASPAALPTRNLNQGRSRLPAGRSYYQGRYYGNFNNRFYGPQYGYF